MNLLFICPLLQVILCSISIVLHGIALSSTHWATFRAKTDLGAPHEVGHYGIWGLCSIKSPTNRDNCDPLETFYRPPYQIKFAGVVASIQTVISCLFLPFVAIRLKQIKRNKPNYIIKTKTVSIIKLSLIFIASILVIITLILTTVPKTASREEIIFHTSTLENYQTWKGWSFWLEFIVCVINIFIVILCLIENNRLKVWILLIESNPTSMSRLDLMSEYFNPHFQRHSHSNQESLISTISDPTNDGWIGSNAHECQLFNKLDLVPDIPFHSISFNNPTFLNESPDLRRQPKQFINHLEFI